MHAHQCTSPLAYHSTNDRPSVALPHGPVPSCNVCYQVLPPRLVHLVVSDSPKAQPLLALTGLQVLVMQGSTMSAQQLTQVNTHNHSLGSARCLLLDHCLHAPNACCQRTYTHTAFCAFHDIALPGFGMHKAPFQDAVRVDSNGRESLSRELAGLDRQQTSAVTVQLQCWVIYHQPSSNQHQQGLQYCRVHLRPQHAWRLATTSMPSLSPSPSPPPLPHCNPIPWPQLPVALQSLREVHLGYDRGNMEAITAAAPGWPSLQGLIKGLDLKVYPGPLPAQTLTHLAQLGAGLTRLAISGPHLQIS